MNHIEQLKFLIEKNIIPQYDFLQSVVVGKTEGMYNQSGLEIIYYYVWDDNLELNFQTIERNDLMSEAMKKIASQTDTLAKIIGFDMGTSIHFERIK